MRFREFVSLFYLYKMMFSVMIYKIWDQNLSKIFMTGGFLMKVTDRIAVLRGEMEREGIDIWIVPSADYHQSEYVGSYFKARQYMTGFTGSAGTAVFTRDKACLWTDGRYFIQAEKELEGSGITLCKMGEPDCGTIEEFLEEELPEEGVIGFDGRTVGIGEGKGYENAAARKNGSVNWRHDLVGRVWKNRPSLPEEKAFSLEKKYAGESAASKLARVREKMKEHDADVHLLTSLDDIAWLLNIRGNDVAYCPLVLSYLILYSDHGELFADETKFSPEMLADLAENGIALRPYDEIGEAVAALPASSGVLLDTERVSYALYRRLPEHIGIREAENPEILMKCMKNDTEIENIKKAHLKDAAAHTKFMYWLKKNIGKLEITEISAAEKLEAFRAEQGGYLEASFEPISAFADHGAIVHYSATEETNAALAEGKLLLTDTGGHYTEGSTDITRTVALGEVSRREKADFTLVARAMLRLMNTVFLHGCSGANLDCIAREVFWEKRVNFNHGTGHGVGYLLNVHEPPVNFRWKEGRTPAPVLEKNMVITDEPGLYIEGSHGIRLENELLVREDEKNEYGQFMRFEPLTYVPIDLDALLPDEMTEEERGMLNNYHKKVFETVSPYLNEEEIAWLKDYTKPV